LRPPHSNFHGSFPEIETIYRAYQVLLLHQSEAVNLTAVALAKNLGQQPFLIPSPS